MSRANEIPYNIRVELKKVYGTKCRICGADNAEYHHIIPLSWGGTNDIENFLPLCYEHHLMMHGVRNQKSFRKGKSPRTGRPRMIPENYKEILDRYIQCEIGRKECQKLLGMGKSSKLTDAVWFAEFLAEREISAYRNNVDLLIHKNGLHPGVESGWIKYKGCPMEVKHWYPSF